MQTSLWHPLTPKCTWLSQNKSKKNLSKYCENFFRNYALFYMQGVGIFTEITVLWLQIMLSRVSEETFLLDHCPPSGQKESGLIWRDMADMVSLSRIRCWIVNFVNWVGLGTTRLMRLDGLNRVAAELIGRATECLRRAYRPCLGTVRLHSAYHRLERAPLPLGVDLYKDKS